MKILVVDDSEALRYFYVLALREAGHDVVVAGDGAEAVDIFRADPEIRGVLSDVRMPTMNGDVLHREIRGELTARRVVFVAYSTECPADARQYFEDHDVPVEDKGMDIEDVEALVARHFDSHV